MLELKDAILLIGALVGFGGWILQARRSKPEIRVLSSQEKSNLATAAETAADALVKAIKSASEERAEFERRIEKLERDHVKLQADHAASVAEIVDLKRRRADRDREIAELRETNEALTAQVAALTAQIARDTIETRELRDKYERLKAFTNNIIVELKKKGIELDELAGGMPDSISGYRFPK